MPLRRRLRAGDRRRAWDRNDYAECRRSRHRQADDRKLNKPVYGVKGDDVHLDKIDAATQIPPEVTAFRDAVNATYPVKM